MPIRALLAGVMLLAMIPGCARPDKKIEPAPAAPAPAAPAAPAAPPAPRPRLVVLVVVDQLPLWWLEARRELLTGGFARLARDGVQYTGAAYPYAVTFTAAGHAALGTGAPPAVTGVADNERWVPDQKQEVPAARDPGSPILVLAGDAVRPPEDGRSSAALLVDGIADALERATQGNAHTVTISLKDRSAVFVGGRKPDLAVWFDDKQPAMTTSAFYAAEAPAWLRALAQQGQVAKYLGYSWTPLAGLAHAAITGSGDGDPGETISKEGFDDRFPHELAQVKHPAKELGATPAGDLLVLDTARAAIDAVGLGADDVPDLLALSFSSPDVVGHYWGPDSWERLDILVRLDRELDGFLTELDQRFGPHGYALVLTSDHGVTPLVEVTRRAGGEAHRLQRSAVKAAVEKAVDELLGPGKADWIEHVSDNSVFISPALDQHARRAQALDAIVQRLRGMAGIQYAEQTARLAGDCERRAGLERLACHSIVPRDPGHVYFAAAPRSIVTRHSQGTNHGSPNPEDRMVPIFVYARGDARWGTPRLVRDPVTTLQVAPTLAALLGVPAPPAATQPPLP